MMYSKGPWHPENTYTNLNSTYLFGGNRGLNEVFCYQSHCEILVFSFICAWTNGWVNNWDVGDLRRHRVHCYVIVMITNTANRSSNNSMVIFKHSRSLRLLDMMMPCHFPYNWLFVRGNHRCSINSHHKGPVTTMQSGEGNPPVFNQFPPQRAIHGNAEFWCFLWC